MAEGARRAEPRGRRTRRNISPPFTVAGGRITLEEATGECYGATLGNVFSYSIEGNRLKLSTVDDACPDPTIESIVTAKPWRRAAKPE